MIKSKYVFIVHIFLNLRQEKIVFNRMLLRINLHLFLKDNNDYNYFFSSYTFRVTRVIPIG